MLYRFDGLWKADVDASASAGRAEGCQARDHVRTYQNSVVATNFQTDQDW